MNAITITFTKQLLEHNHTPTLKDSLNLLEENILIGDELGIGWLARTMKGEILDGTAWATELYLHYLELKFNIVKMNYFDFIYDALNALIDNESSTITIEV
jgi:hypothetical protein